MRAVIALALTSALLLSSVTLGAVDLMERRQGLDASEAALAGARAEASVAHLAAVRSRTRLAALSARGAQLVDALGPLLATDGTWVEKSYLDAVVRSVAAVQRETPVVPPPAVAHVDESIESVEGLTAWTARFEAMDRLAAGASVPLDRALDELETAVERLAGAASRSGAASIAAAPSAGETFRTGSASALAVLTKAFLDDAGLIPALTGFAASIVALDADHDAAVARAAAAAAAAAEQGGGGGTGPRDHPTFTPPVAGPRPTIITNAWYLPGCAGYQGWTWGPGVTLAGGSTYEPGYTFPWDYVLLEGWGWSFAMKTCV